MFISGEISRFLYNLEEHEYYEIGNNYFNLAREIDPKDYRPDWFQGFFKVQAARLSEGMTLMKPIAEQLNDHLPPYFWTDYAIASYISLMHWTSYDAYKKYKSFGIDDVDSLDSIYKEFESKIIMPKQNKKYEAKEIWEKIPGTKYFISNMIAMRILEKENWDISFQGFNNGNTAVIIKPERYYGYNNQKVGTTIVSLIATKQEKNNNLEEFLNTFIQDSFKVEKLDIELPYENFIAYELKDGTKYQDQGGGQFILIGFEKSKNNSSIMKLEVPGLLESSDDDKFYQLSKIYDRFDENIFYVFMLDSCSAVYESSKNDFYNFITNNIKIE